jgi:ferredoxin
VSDLVFFIDYARCIGCQACVQACEECDTHRGRSMIHLETIRRRDSVQTAPQVCMHCEDPICARVSAAAVNAWVVGGEEVRTKVHVVVPRGVQRMHVDLVQIGSKGARDPDDVAALLEEEG